MAHYLLIARFTLDDIPLALLTDKSWAEKHAKDLQANPSLLTTKWKKALDAWPSDVAGFAGAVVLHIDVTGDPVGVTFDSTEYVDKEGTQPPEPQPTQPTVPVPDGYVEITDPNHKLRPFVDFYLSLSFTPGEWISITETDAALISDFGPPARFCCPATQHPDLQGTPAASLPTETDELKVLREANDLLNRAYALLSTQNAELRQLNEDLNHRLHSALTRASRATDLESRIRKMAINFVQFHAKLRERRVWSSVFATEKQMSPAYTQALLTVDSAFTDVFVSFLRSFPHVQPDMPDEWQIGPEKTDDDDGTTD